MKLIKLFFQDTKSHHMLLCLAYHDNEVDSTALLALDSGAEEKHLPYSEVEVKNLDSSDLGTLLAQLLHINNESALKPLMSLMLDKTKGNPNLVVQLVQHLESKHLLTISDEC
jgi:predicted ATPase